MDEFETQVTEVINSAKQEDGSWKLPDDLDPAVKYAATAELRRRDTQSALSKTKADLELSQKRISSISEAWEADVSKSLNERQRAELEELKNSDPEAWRNKLNDYEQQNKESARKRREEVDNKAKQETELERRTRLLEEHNAANPELALTDDVIENDIPPRFVKQLEKGEIDFEEFVNKCATFLGKGKKIASGDEAPNEPDLSKVGGSDSPRIGTPKGSSSTYEKETY